MNQPETSKCVFLSGATGFLGTHIARSLVQEPGTSILALVRAESQPLAERRLARAWWDWAELRTALDDGRRVEVLCGDIGLPNLGLDEGLYRDTASRISHIIHAAADLRVDAPLAELRQTNLTGTGRMLALAQAARANQRLQRFTHISTAYVAGARQGNIPEDSLSGEAGFANAYEQSKFEGECLVQAAKSELPVSVFRPGMVVGDSRSGEVHTFNTIYYPLRLYLSGKLAFIPADPRMRVNLVPVDYVAESVVRLTFDPLAEGMTFHLTAPHESLPAVGELVDFVRAWAREHLDLRLPRPLYFPIPLAGWRWKPDEQARTHRMDKSRSRTSPARRQFQALQKLSPYFNDRKRFQRENVDRLSGAYHYDWREFLPRLLAYAVGRGFLHHNERSVHEQLLARLESASRPVTYYDIVDGRLVRRSAAEMRAEVLKVKSALSALGIRAGERVAIVGLNSSRYLALDAAIGLLGALSVPLYYTCPPAEISHILAASGARLLLVGAPKILERLDEIESSIPVVTFCRQPLRKPPARTVMAWETFLAQGVDQPAPENHSVGFADLATLRYTSGTTGQPKGVSFQQQHLRWMGATMAGLLPWKARCRPAHYLSFLPMNHVVEGILATYCPYYLPSAVNIYFLEDLKDLARALKLVRPTVFFSVPRIYERIWAALENNPLGCAWTRLEKGWLKRSLGALLRWQTLRKSGLQRCAQLMAGSAPCSETLLHNFSALGIEIHNAYGLTEAPLVSLNRLGANRIGTVGEPLPETQIRQAPDGEVLVRGPQVMAGYYQVENGQPFQDGWLLTGDLGRLTPEGSLVLSGRKKELIKTSYGKYVQPAKVEARLREIPGVAEAMLVGEGRPFCVALLWLQNGSWPGGSPSQIDSLIEQVNHNLPQPERVRRWAVLPNDLSIEGGDLTANLKLKRREITRRLAAVLESLYNRGEAAPLALHVGEAIRE